MMHKHGLIVGTFSIPHQGHQFLFDTALSICEKLTIVVSARPGNEKKTRQILEWIQAMCPVARVLVLGLPIERWRDFTKELAKLGEFDVLVGSTPFIEFDFAADLGILAHIVDPNRECVPINSSSIAASPFKNWHFIPPVVRPNFVKRVCFVGPESSGKSSIAKRLAVDFNTRLMPEYGRIYTEQYKIKDWVNQDFLNIADGHIAMRQAVERQANRILIEDTDPLLTQVWSDYTIGEHDPWFETQDGFADFYILLDPNLPWVYDPVRYMENQERRQWFFDETLRLLKEKELAFKIVTGTWEQRLEAAKTLIKQLYEIDRW